jgi:uncharacterized protein YkwD
MRGPERAGGSRRGDIDHMNRPPAPTPQPSRLPALVLAPAGPASAHAGSGHATAHQLTAHWVPANGRSARVVSARRRSAGACSSRNATPAQVNTDELAESTLCLLNAERGRYHLRPLAENRRLDSAATRHAADMEQHKYFSHVSRDGADFVQRIRRAGYLRNCSSWFVGENLAWGAGAHRSTPQGIVAAWMASPPHRANILNGRFREIGIGIAIGTPRSVRGNPPAATYATSFGSRG